MFKIKNIFLNNNIDNSNNIVKYKCMMYIKLIMYKL